MFCSKCGTTARDDHSFCRHCGNRLAAKQISNTPATPIAPQLQSRTVGAALTQTGLLQIGHQPLSGLQAAKLIAAVLGVAVVGAILVSYVHDQFGSNGSGRSNSSTPSASIFTAAVPQGVYTCELGYFSFQGSTVTVRPFGDERTIAFRMNGDSVLLNTAADEWPAMLTFKGGKLYEPTVGDALGTMRLKECMKQQ